MALITCKECGAQISEFAESCPSCGAVNVKTTYTAANSAGINAQPTQQNQFYQQPMNQQGPPPKTWLVESILVVVLCTCGLPFGIAGIVNATKVESRWYAGDKDGALQASKDAAKWTKIGFFVGIVGIILYVLLIVVFGVMGNAGRFY